MSSRFTLSEKQGLYKRKTSKLQYYLFRLKRCGMNFEIFTIENRKDLIPLAEKSARNIAQFIGIPATVVTPQRFDFSVLKYPNYAKAWIWDLAKPNTDKILYLDSDVAMIKPFSNLEKMDGAFYACDDVINYLNADLGLPKVPNYFNAGIFFCSRESKPVFKKLQEILKDETWDDHMYEQHWMNILVHQILGGYSKLDLNYNWLPCLGDPPANVINWHFAGMGERGVQQAALVNMIRDRIRYGMVYPS